MAVLVENNRDSWLARWNRRVFKVFGPAQLGDLSVPVPPFDPDPPCPRCGALDSAHIKHRKPDGKLLCRCPDSTAALTQPVTSGR